jgi:hypothetical protein
MFNTWVLTFGDLSKDGDIDILMSTVDKLRLDGFGKEHLGEKS